MNRADEIQSAGEQPVEISACEWPVRDWGGTRSCGRNGGKTPYTMALCWQHENAFWSHVLYVVEHDRHFGKARMSELTDAILRSRFEDGSKVEVPRGWSDAIDQEIVRRIEAGSTSPEVARAIDDLITERLARKWGAA